MIENDKLVRKTRVYSEERNAPIYKNEVVITKEEFLECFNEWVVKPSQGTPASLQTKFHVPADSSGIVPA